MPSIYSGGDSLAIFFFFLQDKILLYPNLSVYVCKVSSWKLELRPLHPTKGVHGSG